MKNLKITAVLAALLMSFPCISGAASADESTVTVKPSVSGDVNGDDVFNLSDMIMYSRWLLGKGSISVPSAGDVNKDLKTDIFDYIEMKKILLSCISDEEPDAEMHEARNLCQGIKASGKDEVQFDDEFIMGQTEFAVELLKNSAQEDENTLVSPYSVMQALAMTANGADSITKEEMEKVLGGLTIEKLNEYLYTQRISAKESGDILKTANSIWINNEEDIKIEPEFIQANVDYFDSEIYSAPFNDATLKEINSWVNQKTNEKIPEILEKFGPNAFMELINAIAFDADWAVSFNENNNIEGIFNVADGTQQNVEMLRSTEPVYLSCENAEGFMKMYEGGKYAFAAFLPDENTSVDEFVEGLTAESLYEMLSHPNKSCEAIVSLPKFKTEYDIKLNDVLKSMGMPTAFSSGEADFSKMCSSNGVYIEDIIHKTFLELDEKGTTAAAATAVEMTQKAIIPEKEPKIICFNKPFVYCIVDTVYNIPIFIGVMNKI